MSFIERIVQRTGDRILYGFGSQSAKGRLKVGLVADRLHSDWSAFRGANGQDKSWSSFADFMNCEYGAELDPNQFNRLLPHDEIDELVMRVALKMIRNGQVEIDL